MRKISISAFILAGFFLLGLPKLSLAADCTVTTSADSGAGSLRDCIDNVATNDGDAITIDPSVTTPIGLTSGTLDINASITINGAGPMTSIIDGSGNGDNRIITIDGSVPNKTINISGVTLRNATFSDVGAGIYLADNVLNLSNCEINNNTGTGGASEGGGIFMDFNTALTIDSCQFNNNEVPAGGNGGAIFNDSSILFINNSRFFQNIIVAGMGGEGGAIFLDGFSTTQILNSTFEENSGDGNGGGISHNGHALAVDNSTFHKNIATNGSGGGIFSNGDKLLLSFSNFTENEALGGGGLYIQNDVNIENIFVFMNTATGDNGGGIVFESDSIIRNSTIINNSTTGGNGGGIHNNGGIVLIENCTVADNQAFISGGNTGEGGGIHADNDTQIINSTIFSNEAQAGGGGLSVEDTVVLNNVTIANNSTEGDGGGIQVQSNTLIFSNSIISGNSALGVGPDCINNDVMQSLGPNLIQDLTDCTLTSGSALGGDPMLAMALANNGGPGIGRDGANPTQTLALGGGSAALEVGDNITCEPTDQRGTVRPQGTNCDLGAFEAGPSADLSSLNITFADQIVGTTSGVQTVTLTNNGPVPLTINSITLGGIDAGDFAQTTDCGASLAAGASCNISGTFTPTATGVRLSEITVDTSANIQVIVLLGVGIVVTGGGCSCDLYDRSPDNPWGSLVLGISLMALGIFTRFFRGRIMKTFFIAALVFTAGLSLGLVQNSYAADCTVTSGGDSMGPTTPGELRHCIDVEAINSGDTITINPNLMVNLTEGILNVNASINIVGGGIGSSVIDGAGNVPSRIFNIDSMNLNVAVQISDMTLQNAVSDSPGGAIFVDSTGTLSLENVSFVNNESDVRGGAINSEGALLIYNSIFSLNKTDGDGGALFVDAGPVQISDSTLQNNTAQNQAGAIFQENDNEVRIQNSVIDNNTANTGRGGAISNSNGVLIIVQSDLTNNDALDDGGGALQIDDHTVLENCLLSGNTASGDTGGAIHNDGDLIIMNSTISNNIVTNAGAGGVINHGADLLLINSTVSGNQQLGSGSGAGLLLEGNSNLQNVTIFGNTAAGDGGGVFNDGTTVMNNSTIANNTCGDDGGGVFNSDNLSFSNSILAGNTDNGGQPDCLNTSTMISVGPNLIQDPTGCVLTNGTAINADPVLAMSLANNGGPGIGMNGADPTLTLALEENSPALEAGDNASCEPTDQRGTVRPQGNDCDLGAYEAGPSADLSAMSLTFADQVVGTTSAAQTITLTNNGPIPLTINSIGIAGMDAGDFAQTNDCGSSVAAGGSCNISGTFTPTTDGLRQAEISVDSSANVQVITLLGSGIIVTGNGCSLNPMAFGPGNWGGFLLLGASVGTLLAIRKKRKK